MPYSPELCKSQLGGVGHNAEKGAAWLQELQESLLKWERGEARKWRKPGIKGVGRIASSILSAVHMKEIFIYDIKRPTDLPPCLFYLATLENLNIAVLGKPFLFTDRSDWTNGQIVGACRSQHHVEEAFKRMRDPEYPTFRPAYHFTGSKMRVDAFYCAPALLLPILLNRELQAWGSHQHTPHAEDFSVGSASNPHPENNTYGKQIATSYSGLKKL
jgi:hypothetical protein